MHLPCSKITIIVSPRPPRKHDKQRPAVVAPKKYSRKYEMVPEFITLRQPVSTQQRGKATHINALHKRVLGKKRRDNPLLLGNVTEDSEEGASSEVEDVENVEDEEEVERVEQEDGDDKAIMIIIIIIIRSAIIMANLIEGRDPVMSASDDSAINTNMVREVSHFEGKPLH
ncbi:hypothetical protein CEUSTIGMA_g13290.t1 [Chlamydomonas eustigma]|uniref:Uncharacterized protein n=1 Tax=Chlamydomonas eustigma TaxID=1157962 RepID=A0A250XS41_9CHLO|nr:hypothetical protein CEUSTIGMA_g13290.t1 [Chlamydomonas eustigma]|eukprot:GAX85874.1 hypothetical protein CEUSTIGMA_g13290.t1 [Chlamydomonas eustigma]